MNSVNVYHPGDGNVALCFKSSDYHDVCEDINLAEYQSPFVFPIEVEDPSNDETTNLKIVNRWM